MNNSEILYNLLATNSNLYVMLWNATDGWMPINAEGCPSLSSLLFADGNISSILDVVADEDFELCRAFLNTLKSAPDMSNPVKRRCVNLHLLSKDNQYIYCNVECDSFWKDKREPQDILLKIRELTAEEIYQIDLATQKTIVAQKPNWFAEKEKALFRESGWKVCTGTI